MGINRTVFLLLILVSLSLSINLNVQAQDSLRNVNDSKKLDLAFIDFLINNQEHEDALLILKERLIDKSYQNSQLDSIYFYTAWAFYNLKSLDSSIVYFEKIKIGSPLEIASHTIIFQVPKSKKHFIKGKKKF